MASVVLREVWIHDADDLADNITGDGFGDGGPEDSVRGEVRTYSQGRRRAVKRKGEARTYGRTFPSASVDLVDWLTDHLGRTVMVRDPRGRLFWAVYFAVSVPDRHGRVRPDVTISFESVTFSEVA